MLESVHVDFPAASPPYARAPMNSPTVSPDVWLLQVILPELNDRVPI